MDGVSYHVCGTVQCGAAAFDWTLKNLLGGDDGSGRKYTPQTNPGFNNQSLCLDTATAEWHDGGPIGAPRAVLPCCAWEGRFIAVNGELKPGRRSPEVWSISLP